MPSICELKRWSRTLGPESVSDLTRATTLPEVASPLVGNLAVQPCAMQQTTRENLCFAPCTANRPATARLYIHTAFLSNAGSIRFPPVCACNDIVVVAATAQPTHQSEPMNHLLIAGASGIIGQAAVEHFAGLPNWRVSALSRRRADWPTEVSHVALDLMDRDALCAGLGSLNDVTHLLYTALYELPDLVAGWRDTQQMAINLAMLRNLLDALQVQAPALRHITLMQGAKAYGTHIAPAPVPAKERWPRHAHENFYWLQEDLLRERQPRAAWTFTILRPQFVVGHASGSPMNVLAAIGAYAATSRENGEPLHFPGGGRYVTAATDSRLIAAATEFAATQARAANETYNIVNGDALVWQDLWPAVADCFGMTVGEPKPRSLAAHMPLQQAAWSQVAKRHGLRESSLANLAGQSWQFTDRVLAFGNAQPAASLLSPIKLRQHGFADCLDTEDSLRYWLAKLQRERWLPN